MALSLLKSFRPIAYSALKAGFRARKKKMQERLFLIPFLFTFLNAFFGLLSVINTFEEQYSIAAYYILLAVCMDFFDGRLARAFGSCSGLGQELDSLCDAVSFCFAPAILLYAWRLHGTGALGILAVSTYLCVGLFRLAKFNALHMNQKPFFIGLPTTIAASFIATMVLASSWITSGSLHVLVSPIGLVCQLFVLALLMPSSLHFASFKKYTMKKWIAKVAVSTVAIASLYCVYVGFPVFFLAASAYIVGNIAINLTAFFSGK